MSSRQPTAQTSRGCLAVVPARWGARRLPGKPLLDLGGLPLVEHVRRRVCAARGVDRVVVATDDARVARAVEEHGGEAVMTGEHPSGTHRVAEVAASLDYPHVINVQGDQPLLDPAHVEAVVELLRAGAPIATLGVPLDDPSDPALVKVVCRRDGTALYFSRAAIPHRGPWMRHLGLYGFQREVLARAVALPEAMLERAEDLEQLRWLEGGLPIRVAVVQQATTAVDTPDQLRDLSSRFARGELAPPK